MIINQECWHVELEFSVDIAFYELLLENRNEFQVRNHMRNKGGMMSFITGKLFNINSLVFHIIVFLIAID